MVGGFFDFVSSETAFMANKALHLIPSHKVMNFSHFSLFLLRYSPASDVRKAVSSSAVISRISTTTGTKRSGLFLHHDLTEHDGPQEDSPTVLVSQVWAECNDENDLALR